MNGAPAVARESPAAPLRSNLIAEEDPVTTSKKFEDYETRLRAAEQAIQRIQTTDETREAHRRFWITVLISLAGLLAACVRYLH